MCGGGCVSACVMQFSITVTHLLSKKSPNKFSCPRIFFGVIDFDLKFSEL